MMCLVLSVMAFAQTGVDFQHLTFDEALAKAKAEKKLVFVDCYTTWCGPCKMMTTKIFPMKEAGEFFNPRFVPINSDSSFCLESFSGILTSPKREATNEKRRRV